MQVDSGTDNAGPQHALIQVAYQLLYRKPVIGKQ